MTTAPFDIEDDTDERAFQAARSIICSASTDGQVTIHRRHECGLVLTAEEALTVHEFLANTAAVWSSPRK